MLKRSLASTFALHYINSASSSGKKLCMRELSKECDFIFIAWSQVVTSGICNCLFWLPIISRWSLPLTLPASHIVTDKCSLMSRFHLSALMSLTYIWHFVTDQSISIGIAVPSLWLCIWHTWLDKNIWYVR
jgi:hypothetical protein